MKPNRRIDKTTEPYVKKMCCPSCGECDISTTYCEGHDGDGAHDSRPLMHRLCLACGYKFDQLPHSERRVTERRVSHTRRDDNGGWDDILKEEKER